MASIYHRDMPGAPLGGGPRFNDYILRILKACLVTGFGSAPGAGWTLVDESPSYLVLRNGVASGYLCVALYNQVITISMADTYDGVNMSGMGIIQGIGAISGTAAGNASPQRFTRQYFGNYPSNESWIVVADDRSAVLAVSGNSGGSPDWVDSVNTGVGNGVLYLGDDSNGNLIAAGGQNTTSDVAVVGCMLRGLTSLRNPATGLLQAPLALTFSHLGMAAGNQNLALPGEIPDLRLTPVRWACGGVYGALRGLARCPDIGCMNPLNMAKALGITDGLTTRTINTPIVLDDGYSYFVSVIVGGQGEGFLITDNPEFW